MKRKIEFSDSLVDGDEMRYFLEIFPSSSDSFRQRKQYDEYYYDSFESDIDIDMIERLNEAWSVCIHSDTIELV